MCLHTRRQTLTELTACLCNQSDLSLPRGSSNPHGPPTSVHMIEEMLLVLRARLKYDTRTLLYKYAF